MSAFSWLGDIFNWFGKLFPRILLIRKTHGGVAFRLGKYVKGLNPGIYVYWPIITEVVTYPTARQTTHLPTQCLMTSDGHSIVVGGIVRYKISNIVAALGEAWDIDDIITDVSLGAISIVITQKSLQQAAQDIKGIGEALTEAVKDELYEFGVEVLGVRLANCSKCLVIKNIGGDAAFLPQEEKCMDDEYDPA